MTKDEWYELAMGAAAVALLYALWQHRKTGGGMQPAAPFTISDPTKPDHGLGLDPYHPTEFISIADLLKGTVADFFTGTKAAEDIPTASDLAATATADYYNVQERPGDFMRNDGAYW